MDGRHYMPGLQDCHQELLEIWSQRFIPPLAGALLIVLDLRRLHRDRQALPRESAASKPEGSREDAGSKMFPGSPGYWAIAGEARPAQPAWAWHPGLQRPQTR